MDNLDAFHDGAFEGLLVSETTVQLFLSTYEKERFVLVAEGVVALTASGLQLGNIILDVEERTSNEITVRDIYEVFSYGGVPNGEKRSEQALLMAQKEGLSLIAVNPSYGGSCLLLAKATKLLRFGELAEPLVSVRVVESRNRDTHQNE
jgi:hypothetical protein